MENGQILARSAPELGGEVGHGKVIMDELTKSTIRLFDKWLHKGVIDRLDEVAVFGSYLYKAIFNGEVHEKFNKTYHQFNEYRRKNPDSILRIVLEFHSSAKELAGYPWEYLYYPDSPNTGRGFFIASKNALILLRHVPLEFPSHVQPETELRILIVSSSPNELPELLLDPVIKAIDEFATSNTQKVRVEKLKDPHSDKFIDKLVEFRPHILHFIGHGRWNRENQAGEIAFLSQDDDNKADWIEDYAFADFFADYQPEVIFLHACEGATTETIERFKGLALQLVYSRIPVVVAMQYPIENIIACQFASKFYECLGRGKPIDRAVQEGRALLKIYQRKNTLMCRAFGIPVVYSRYLEGGGLSVDLTALSPELIAPQEVKTEPCPNCNAMIPPTYVKCPKCRAAITTCNNCHKLMAIKYGVCGYCGQEYRAKESQAEVRAVKNDIVRGRELPTEL
jgi:hypothetical protein